MIELQGKASDIPVKSRNHMFAGHPTFPQARPEIKLVGNFEIDCGNFVLASIVLDGHSLHISGGNCRGIKVRALVSDPKVNLDPASLPAGVTLGPGVLALDENFTKQYKERHADIIKIYDFLRQYGEDGFTAFKVLYEAVQAGSAAMTKEDLKTAFDAAIGDAPIDAERFLDKLQSEVGGVTWAQFRDFVQASSVDRLKGLPTELISEYS